LLSKRVITATIAIPLLIALIYLGSMNLFLIVIMLCVGVGQIEFYKINMVENRFAKAIAIIVGVVGVWFIYYYRDYLSFEGASGISLLFTWLIALMTLALFILMLMQFIFFPKKLFSTIKSPMLIIGILYVSLLLSYLVLIRCSTDGKDWILFTFLVVWFGDIGAYSIGKIIGKNQLCPVASPKKTVEGALGGLLIGLIAAFAAKLLLLKQLTIIDCAVLAIGIAIVGQLGDLFESTFKRMNGVKDSGNLLPGHGGMLDRIDSLLFSAPLVYYYKMFIL